MRKILTDATLRAMEPPEKGYRILWDNSLRGFGCRISQAGTRAFVVLIESGRPKTIGRYPAKTLGDARREAKTMLAEKTLGKVHPTHTAFEDAITAYLDQAKQTLRPLTYKLYRRHLLSHYPFGRQSAADITPRQILKRLDPLPISEKRHAFAIGRTAFKWMERRHILERSPFDKLDVPPDNPSRSRVLTDDELKSIYTTAEAGTDHFERIVALLVLTGQRPQEISHLQWSWMKEDTIEFPAEIAKNKQAWVIPLGPKAKTILNSAPHLSDIYVFPALRVSKATTTVFNGWGKHKARFDKLCGVTGWQLRDLRRTFATNMQRLGVRLEVTEALLNHVSGSQKGIVGVYQRHLWAEEKKAAILQWEQFLATLLPPT